MIVFIPYCDKDYKKALWCLHSIARQGEWKFKPKHEHAIITVYTGIKEDPLKANEFPVMPYPMHRLDKLCITEKNLAVDRVMMTASKKLNHLWHSGLLSTTQAIGGGIMFCEPDVIFTRLGAIDYLEDQLRLAREEKYKIGNYSQTILGHLSYDPEVGLYCNGVAVYDMDSFSDLAEEISTVDDKNGLQPFDISCRKFILERLKPTNAIGQINATKDLSYEEYERMMETPGPVVCWHGVKDDSLWDHVFRDDSERDPLPVPPTIIKRDELPTEETDAG